MSKYKERLASLESRLRGDIVEKSFISNLAIIKKRRVSRNYKKLADLGHMPGGEEHALMKEEQGMAQAKSLKEGRGARKDLRHSETKLRRYKNTYKRAVGRKIGLGLGVAGALAGTAALVAKARSAKKD